MSHWESFKKMLLRQEKHFRLLSKLKKIGMKIFDLQFYFDVILHLEENNLLPFDSGSSISDKSWVASSFQHRPQTLLKLTSIVSYSLSIAFSLFLVLNNVVNLSLSHLTHLHIFPSSPISVFTYTLFLFLIPTLTPTFLTHSHTFPLFIHTLKLTCSVSQCHTQSHFSLLLTLSVFL